MTPTPHPSLYPDWTTSMTRAEAHIKLASDAFLMRDWQKGIDALGEAQQCINQVAGWLIKREVLETK